MAAAVTLPKKITGRLAADETKLMIEFLTALRAGKFDTDEVLLYLAEDVMKRADATEPQEEEKPKKATSKGESRLPAPPKKKGAEEDAGQEDAAVNLREDRKYESSVEKLAGAILEWTGKFVTSGANEGHARMKILNGSEKVRGKVVPVPVDSLKVTRKRVAKEAA